MKGFQTNKSVRPKAEIQKSKHTYVQRQIGYSFHDLVRLALQNGEIQKQLNDMRPTQTKAESVRRVKEGLATKSPIYMSEAEAYNYSMKVLDDLQRLDEIREVQGQAKVAQEIANYKERLRKEIKEEMRVSTSGNNPVSTDAY